MTPIQARIQRVIVSGGIVGAVLAGLVGIGVLAGVGPLQWVQRRVAPVVAAIGLVQILLVGAFLAVGVWVLRESTPPHEQSQRLASSAPPPETPRDAPRLVGADFDAAVAEAVRDVRLKDTAYSDTPPQQTLSETAKTAITLVENCDTATAEQALTTGEWTSDPIAAAFLSESVPFPATFQLLRWATPGEAYERAIGHTTSAITQVLADSAVAAPTPPQPAAPPQGVLERLRSAMQARMAAVDAGDAAPGAPDPSTADTQGPASATPPTEAQPSAETGSDASQEPPREDEHV